LVKQGSNTILRQRRELQQKIEELTELNEQNATLHERVRRAAARTTSLNESFLRRISADLHDGPGQDLGFAVMRTATLDESVDEGSNQSSSKFSSQDFVAVRRALQSALKELRAICSGLQLPDISGLSINAVAERAVSDHQLKTGAEITFIPLHRDIDAAMSIKIAVYRILQESLMNGLRHANGAGQRVCLDVTDEHLLVQVSDKGNGFDPQTAMDNTHLGLKGMRERVALLGGSFDIRSSVGRGTIIDVKFSLKVSEADHD
jgi:signal transduction histidine kinase